MNYIIAYAAAGFLVGLLAPSLGLIFDHYFLFDTFPSELSIEFVKKMHRITPVHYFIDTIPIALAFVAAFAGRKQGTVVFYSQNLEVLVEERTAELAKAKRETDRILANVDEGLFLVDEQFAISNEHSESMDRLFGRGDVGGQPLRAILGEVDDPDFDRSLQDFLELLFDKNFDEQMLLQLNPLSEIAVKLEDTDGLAQERHLKFRFSRAVEDDEIVNILGVATDTTDQVRLQRQVEAAETVARARATLVNAIMAASPLMLVDFVKAAREKTDRMQALFATETIESAAVDEAFSLAHAIKGNSAILDLDLLELQAHTFEEHLVQLRKAPEKATEQRAQLIAELTQLDASIAEVEELFDRIGRYNEALAAQSLSNSEVVERSLAALLRRLAEATGVEVTLVADLDPEAAIADGQRTPLTEILSQFARNSIAHGIEPAGEREAAGKAVAGTVQLQVTPATDGGVRLVYEDDGRGLDPEKLAAKAVAVGLWTQEQVAQHSDQEKQELIFSPRFSTTEAADAMSGRGVGMDVVAVAVQAMGGTLTTESETGRYCRFIVTLPAGDKG